MADPPLLIRGRPRFSAQEADFVPEGFWSGVSGNQDGSIVIDVTWHRVVAWEGERIRNLDQLTKGSAVHVIGRLRTQKYIGMDGCKRTAYEILASELEIIKPMTL